jgi:endonuclease/exonuclease/phosphatase family metal-dependent hydrolase
MVNSQPYNLGIVSSLPMIVVAEYGPPIFQRGLLHVYFIKLDLHVMIVHLHAHSSDAREQEALKVISIIKTLVEKNCKIVVMGDFNTLSPYDSRLHVYMYIYFVLFIYLFHIV